MLINQLIHGDCCDVVAGLADDSIDCIILDPPYGENMGFDGDESVESAEDLLLRFLRDAGTKLKQDGHVAVFWTMRNLDVCIDAVRAVGLEYRRTCAMYVPRGSARPYLGWLPRTQAIVIARRPPGLKPPTEFHTALAKYLHANLLRSGLSASKVAKALGCNGRLVMKWTRVGDPAWCLPTPRFYKPLKELLQLDDTFDTLLDRTPTYTRHQRTDLTYRHDTYIVAEDMVEESIHPCQKPLSVVVHLVESMCPAGGVVLDGFAGSGTTPVACLKTGRNFVAVEKDATFHALAAARLVAFQHSDEGK